MIILRRIKRAIRGEVTAKTVVLEVVRRSRASVLQRSERSNLAQEAKETPRLRSEFARMQPAALLEHFQQRKQPHFFSGFASPANANAASQRRLFPEETDELVAAAERITNEHCWPLLGLGDQCFGTPIDWHRDPLSGFTWPLDYHGDINLQRGDGSDVRFVWELNRLGHLITLVRAYSVNGDQRFSIEFFQQVESWHSGNPLGRGVNWNCAMEVALRAMSLLGALEVFRSAPDFDEQKLSRLIAILDQHGRFVREHLEFSYVATSNHYLSDVIGLLWLGIMLPELEQAEAWRSFGLREMLREMDKQVLADGADFESSTGYHRFVLELFLHSFVLCRTNAIDIEARYWEKLHQMFRYVRAYLRPDGRAPLIGDSDSGQVFPVCHRRGDDHAYLLALGAVLFNDSQLKPDKKAGDQSAGATISPELLWILGEEGVEAYLKLGPDTTPQRSQGFPNAGVYILRDRDLYLSFNASGAGINGRGSHGHNDVLSIEVSACGRPFIIDPGTYIYTGDLHQRHLFRSTAYHSTVQIDDTEQNTTKSDVPFVIGDEAHPRVLSWETGVEFDRVSAEHDGYARLPQPVTHRRTIIFNKQDRCWLLEDEFFGKGNHNFAVRFHFDTGLEVGVHDYACACGMDESSGNRVFICPLDLKQPPELESQSTSRDYGQKLDSVSVCWAIDSSVPAKLRWAIIPACAGEDYGERLRLVARLQEPLCERC